MIDQERMTYDLPDLDRVGDPRGGAVAWALLAVCAVVIAGILLMATWMI
ncbi:MAG: hypothetical protein ACRDSH_21680 [Pseudonocardiaceae bacterium]